AQNTNIKKTSSQEQITDMKETSLQKQVTEENSLMYNINIRTNTLLTEISLKKILTTQEI
ncbi:6743_t:CDS:1, partial [Cetraspora pellucida]